jgi:hypothetical protein
MTMTGRTIIIMLVILLLGCRACAGSPRCHCAAAQDGIDGLQGGAEAVPVALGQVMITQTFSERGAQAVKGVIGEPVQG